MNFFLSNQRATEALQDQNTPTATPIGDALDPMGPFNVIVMDPDKFIATHRLGQVKSFMTFEPSSTAFHKEGLFSEEIFGQIGTPERLTRLGYIDIGNEFIAPICFKEITRLGRLYEEIMSGSAYAYFDEVEKNFIRAAQEDIDNEDFPYEISTGYCFFLKHLSDIKFKETASDERDNRIQLLDKYKEKMLYKKYIVLSAGLRDVEIKDGRPIQDDINKLYISLLSYASSIPKNNSNPIFNSVRYSIQKKAVEIYEYMENIFDGKKGFFQGQYGHRRIALGTRNVISANAEPIMHPDDPQSLKPDEAKLGTYQTMKGMMNFVINHLRTYLLGNIFISPETTKIALTESSTLKLKYSEFPEKEITKFATSEGLEKLINNFRNVELRHRPITLSDIHGVRYHPFLVYDTGNAIYLFRTLIDLENHLSQEQIDRKKIRPLTYVEMFYIATYIVSMNKYAFIVRYPVIEEGSVYPAKIHLMSTSPGRIVKFRSLIDGSDEEIILPQYPKFDRSKMSYHDSTTLSITALSGLGGDHDGDTVSVNYVFSEEACREIKKYLDSYASYITPSGRWLSSASLTGPGSDVINLVLINLSSTKPLKKQLTA